MKHLYFCILLVVLLGVEVMAAPTQKVPRSTEIYADVTNLDGATFVNDKLQYFTGRYVPVNGSAGSLQSFIQRHFKHNANYEKVEFGKNPGAGYGWVFLQLVNQSNAARSLCMNAIYRQSEHLIAYTVEADSVRLYQQVARTTPLAERFYPNYDLVLDFEVPARDTLRLLVRSERLVGPHTVGFVVDSQREYQQAAFWKMYYVLFPVLFTLLCFVASLITGWLFKDGLLLTLAIYMLVLLATILGYNGFFDVVSYSPKMGLSASFVGGFIGFFSHIFYHPFGYMLIKERLKNRTFYVIGAVLLSTLNLVAAAILLLPPPYYNALQNELYASSVLLSTLNILWVFYAATLYYRRGGSIIYLLGGILTLLPLIMRHFIEFFGATGADIIFTLSVFSPYCLIFTFTYLAFTNLNERLILKKTAADSIKEVTNSLAEINRNEIEKIGQNLHDEVGNVLASALGYLDRSEDQYSVKSGELIRLAIGELRLISHQIVKVNDRIPVTLRISKMVDQLNGFSEVSFIFNDCSNNELDTLPVVTQENIYNIVLAATNNAILHAKATEVFIQLFDHGDTIQLSIEDNGIGFDVNEIFDGIGLINMKKRAELIGLRFHIDSNHKGTTLLLEVNLETQRTSHGM